MPHTETGTITRLVVDKGFGFIATPGGPEYFFHRSAVANFLELQEGDTVAFEPTMAPRGPRAEHVVVRV